MPTPSLPSKNRRIKQWIFSFLLVDFIFWILIIGGCILSHVNALEYVTFLPYIFYLPFSLIPQPWWPHFESAWLSVLSLMPLLILIHAGLGALIGLIYKKPIRWWISILFAFIFLLFLATILGRLQSNQEMGRETNTQLWAIYDIRENYIKSTTAEMLSCENNDCPNGFRLNLTEGYTEWLMEDSQDAEVTLIQCPQESGCETNYKTTFEEYLSIRKQCQENPMTCPVYGIGGEYDLFDVTFNPKGITHMEQIYLP